MNWQPVFVDRIIIIHAGTVVMCGYGRVGDCGGIYNLVSQIRKCPPHLSLPGHALKCYATSKNVVHGLHLDCFLRCGVYEVCNTFGVF